MDTLQLIKSTLENSLGQYGFEFHPFKIGWYNDMIKPIFQLNYSYDTIAFLIVSTPQMFDRAFKPFVRCRRLSGSLNPIDECTVYYLDRIKQVFPDTEIDIKYDFELHMGRRPKVLMQTAAHVSGAAYYYRRDDLQEDPWGSNKKIFGVCIHPKYGGWFALRGVAIFEKFTCPLLTKTEPNDVIPEDKKRELLEKFNYHWEDWSYRDIIPVAEKYSEEQKKYFATKPGQRHKIIDEIRNVDSLYI
ncbi:methylmalonic aciduria and homocystinuria type C protein homolog [Centruroides sculpturatus]|uniref:methylmalonic aciduria and homocystinuria type C protein homolog n=1 Tax=Centruroides sculpturatus TaxID=218467 RepID=UPI000C6DDC7A|nr:methylmalonic aciduria and homocystinuria type C protein homolog [Centruroides sculpturatus]